MQTLQHGLHLHADLIQWSLGWKMRDVGNVALGLGFTMNLGAAVARSVPGAGASALGCTTLQTASVQTLTPFNKRTNKFFFFNKMHQADTNIKHRAPEKLVYTFLKLCQLLPPILMGPFFWASELSCCCQAQTNSHFIQNWVQDWPGKKRLIFFIKVSHYLSSLCLLCVSLDYNLQLFLYGKRGLEGWYLNVQFSVVSQRGSR